jgi:phage I-like protein
MKTKKPTPTRSALALAACHFQLAAPAADRTLWLQATPDGLFRPADGREMPVAAWRIDQAVASKVIERFRARRTPPVVDYEHQTLHKEQNGQPAPAAGWMRDIEYRAGEGLFIQVELTARAADLLTAGEYRYFSPVFMFDPVTGDVLDMLMGAITNNPAIDGMQALALQAAATFGLPTTEEPIVNELLKAVIAALGLAETATEEEAIAALKSMTGEQAALCAQLGIAAGSKHSAMLAACTGLKAAAKPDPAKFVPVEAFTSVQNQLAALTARVDGDAAERLIQDGLADGRILPAMEGWARDLAKSDMAALSKYLEQAAPIAALTKTQTGGQPPAGGGEGALSAEEMAVCSRMGLTPEQFKAAKES